MCGQSYGDWREGAVEEEKKDDLKRFNRLLVWPTLIFFIILAISGYGIVNPGLVGELTGGLFGNSIFSLRIHMALVLPTLMLLMTHVLIAIRSTLIRWGVREGKLLNAFLILLGAFTVALIVLMQFVGS
jgi:cytochrome b subunit of formate dehydrogenase